MASFGISVDVGRLVAGKARADSSSFPTLSYAVQQIAEAAQAQWVSYAMGEPLPSGETINPRTGTYARSIQLRQKGDFVAEVYSDLSYAQDIETGAPARDMKRMLGTSAKVRTVSNPKSPNFGKRYLIIPFRWSTQGKGGVGANVMPGSVAAWWQAKKPSHVLSVGRRVSGLIASGPLTRRRMTTPDRTYIWGDRLTKQDMSRLGIRGAGARQNMAGVVNFRKPGGKGGGAHSQFLTFRVMMEGSGGWVTKPTPGKYPAKAAAMQLQAAAEKAFAKAIEIDLQNLLGG